MAAFRLGIPQLPPGFRFQPTDQEIIVDYLDKKIAGTATSVTSIVADVDIYKFDPWDLPDKAIVFGDGEWFFFSPRDRKYPNGGRPNRTAGSGYWKATGTDKPILAAGGAPHCLGVKKALVFYQGRSPKGTKTEWVMHEYRLLLDQHHHIVSRRPNSNRDSMRLDDWVLCRVRKKGVCYVDYATSSDQPTMSPVHISRDVQVPTVNASSAGGFLGDVVVEGWNYSFELASADIGGGGAAASTGTGHQYYQGSQTGQLVSSMLESIKRKLSFQAIDELYLLQPTSKRANTVRTAAAGDDEQMSPTSFSISETDEVF